MTFTVHTVDNSGREDRQSRQSETWKVRQGRRVWWWPLDHLIFFGHHWLSWYFMTRIVAFRDGERCQVLRDICSSRASNSSAGEESEERQEGRAMTVECWLNCDFLPMVPWIRRKSTRRTRNTRSISTGTTSSWAATRQVLLIWSESSEKRFPCQIEVSFWLDLTGLSNWFVQQF